MPVNIITNYQWVIYREGVKKPNTLHIPITLDIQFTIRIHSQINTGCFSITPLYLYTYTYTYTYTYMPVADGWYSLSTVSVGQDGRVWRDGMPIALKPIPLYPINQGKLPCSGAMFMRTLPRWVSIPIWWSASLRKSFRHSGNAYALLDGQSKTRKLFTINWSDRFWISTNSTILWNYMTGLAKMTGW